MFQGLKPCSNDAPHNLLSNDVDESFWDALWLELWPFEVLTTVFFSLSFRWVFVIATMFNRCVAQFAIIITNRQLLKRLVARAMASFVFSWKAKLTSRCKKPIWGHDIGQIMDIAKKPEAKANLRARPSGNKIGGYVAPPRGRKRIVR